MSQPFVVGGYFVVGALIWFLVSLSHHHLPNFPLLAICCAMSVRVHFLVLLALCLASLIAFADASTNSAVFTNRIQMVEQMRREGIVSWFEVSPSSESRCVVLGTNFSEILNDCLTGWFEKDMANALSMRLGSNAPSFSVYAYSNSQVLELNFALRENKMTSSERKQVNMLFNDWVRCRLDGHSLDYTRAWLREDFDQRQTNAVLSLTADDSRRFRVPNGWLRTGADGELYIVDGPIAWVFTPIQTCVDAKEYDPKFQDIIASVRQKVFASRQPDQDARNLYEEVKRILGRDHSINWLSPLELNPGRYIHLAPKPTSP